MAVPPWLVSLGVKYMFKRWRERVAARAMETARGKLTYASIAAILLPVISSAVGIEIVPADIEPIYQGVLAAVALFGKWRASRNYGS